MILTVTPNTGIDHTLIVPEFRLDATLRATEVAWGMGAKTTDVSWVLGQWGAPNRAIGFAAGHTGRRMEAMLRERGVSTDFVQVDGETRVNTVIVCASTGQQSTITANTLQVGSGHIEALMDQYTHALPQATCVVAGGSLPDGVPPTFYPDLIRAARSRDIPIIFDSSGPSLRDGLAARPSLIKPNRAELAELMGCPAGSTEEVYRQACALQSAHGVDLIVTLGPDGALALVGDRHYRIPALPVKAVSTAGAGDAVLAGMAIAMSRREPLENGLRLGFALGSAVLLTAATADFRPEDARRFLHQIELIPISRSQDIQ